MYLQFQPISPVPSTSTSLLTFSPEELRPFPKAPPRKTKNRGRKTRKSTIYTDTPEKEEMRKECEKRIKRINAKQVKKRINGSKSTVKNKKNNKPSTESSEDEEEYYCLVCVGPYSQSRPGEKWIQCSGCKLWSHEDCTEGSLSYYCHNCESD